MSSERLQRLRVNLLAKGYSDRPKANQRKRNNQIVGLALENTTDPRLQAVSSKRHKAEERRKRSIQHSPAVRPTKTKRQSGSVRRRNYATGPMEAADYYANKQAMKSAEKQEKHQKGFPDAHRHPTTIGIAILPQQPDAAAETVKNRSKLHGVANNLSPGCCVVGAFQIEMMTAARLAKRFPKSEWPEGFDPILKADQLWGYLHAHLVIADPWLTRNQIRKILKKEYPGSDRVCIRRVRPVVKLEDGTETYGAQGFLEYAWINRCKGDFATPAKTAEALIEFAKIDATWNARSRGFRSGKSLEKSGVVIDPQRTKYIEAQDRLQWIKDHWDQLGHAEQFLHLWLSGKIELLERKSDWVRFAGGYREAFKLLLSELANWVYAAEAKDVDFSEFFVIPLRE